MVRLQELTGSSGVHGLERNVRPVPTPLPSFAELPIAIHAPPHSSWGVWGDEDRLGCWNKIDSAATQRGASCVRRGRAFRLDVPHDPDLARFMHREPFVRRVEPIMGVAWDDVVDGFNTQASSQWDGFGHFASRAHGHYGGLDRDAHGVDHWAVAGFATRGVLADIARWRIEQGRPLNPLEGEMVPLDELEATLAWAGVELAPGDVLLLRFGWLSAWRAAGRPNPGFPIIPGIEPSVAAAEWLWDRHVAAVGGDPGVDPVPGKFAERVPSADDDFHDPGSALALSLHNVIPYLGMSLGEFLDLDALALDCAADGDWTCQLTVAPMQLPGGVATPANAIAIR